MRIVGEVVTRTQRFWTNSRGPCPRQEVNAARGGTLTSRSSRVRIKDATTACHGAVIQAGVGACRHRRRCEPNPVADGGVEELAQPGSTSSLRTATTRAGRTKRAHLEALAGKLVHVQGGRDARRARRGCRRRWLRAMSSDDRPRLRAASHASVAVGRDNCSVPMRRELDARAAVRHGNRSRLTSARANAGRLPRSRYVRGRFDEELAGARRRGVQSFCSRAGPTLATAFFEAVIEKLILLSPPVAEGRRASSATRCS